MGPGISTYATAPERVRWQAPFHASIFPCFVSFGPSSIIISEVFLQGHAAINSFVVYLA